MKDAERIYALYVQANPVPDPDLLPLSPDEAVLLTIEGSPDMITQEPTETRPAPRAPRRRNLAAAGAVAAVIVIGVVAALLLTGDDGPVAAADANPVVTFDGETCTYEGPEEILEGTISFSFVNSSEGANVKFAAFQMNEASLAAELERTPVGTAMDDDGGPGPDGELQILVYSLPGDLEEAGYPLTPGTYIIDCGTDFPDRLWRAARVEVVAP